MVRPLLPAGIAHCTDATDAARDANALLVLSEWHEFRAVSATRLYSLIRGRVVVDLRNIWDPAAILDTGLNYSSVGRPK